MATSGISFSGLFSGLDTESIISQLMTIERQPITLLENKKLVLKYQKQTLDEVNNSLISLQSIAKSFTSGTTSILENTATSSDESILTATADITASKGIYDVVVNQIAKAHRVASDTAPVYTNNLNDQFVITVDGTGYTVTVDSANATLSQIAGYINDDAGAVVTASVVTDPVTGNKTLTIESNNTGDKYEMSFADVGPATVLQDIGVIDAIGVIQNLKQAALNAQLTVEGVDIESYSNDVTGAIQGVILNLIKTGSATVTVGLDADAVIAKVSEFVEQFNKTTNLLAQELKEDKVKEPQSDEDYQYGVLRGDYDLADIKSQIRLLITNNTDGNDVDGNPISGWSADYRIMAQIGVESEPYYGGSVSANLTFDESKIRTALADDPSAVSALLQEVGDRVEDYLKNQTKVSSVKEFAGNIYRRILGIDERTRMLDDDIYRLEESMAKVEERYRTSFTQMEQYLQSIQDESTYLMSQLNNLLKSTSSGSK